MEKILVVDDETHILRILKNYLQTEAYQVYTATSGEEAIQKVREVEPRIVLLDIIMPGKGGINTLKEIKKINPRTAVIIISAVIDEELARRALECGADDYITKPFDLNFLGKRVRIKMLQLLNNEDIKESGGVPSSASPARKILLIDDEEDFCRALKKRLEMRNDFQVFTATGGDEGIRLARIQKPDVILLDIMMPDKSGTLIAEELLEHPATSSIPIIFVTALIKTEETEQNKGMIGGHTFIAKPVMIDELIEKINVMSPGGAGMSDNN